MDVSLKCQCGSFQGVAKDISAATGSRIVCLCDDCQAYAHFLGRAADVLDSNGGTDVFPVAPSHLKITQGAQHLRCIRLSEQGMYRWYAGCCKSPIANSMPSAKIPFAGTIHTIMDHAADGTTREQALGPVRARVQSRFGIGVAPEPSYQTVSLGIILLTLRFLLRGWIKGESKPSPFFDSAGQPVVKPQILSPAEREHLRTLCGPRPA